MYSNYPDTTMQNGTGLHTPLKNMGNMCHLLSLLHLLAEIETDRVFNLEMRQVLDYVRGNDNNPLAFYDLQTRTKNYLHGRQDDPHDDMDLFYRDGNIIEKMGVNSIFDTEACSSSMIQANMVDSLPAISISPELGMPSQDVQYLVNNRGTKQLIGKTCKRTLVLTELIGKKYLIVFIERAGRDGKIRTPVFVNNILHLDNLGNVPSVFKLKAVIIHCGNKTTSGHYVVFVMNQTDGKWYLYDDAKKPAWTPFRKFEDFNKTKYNCGTLENDATTLLYETLE